MVYSLNKHVTRSNQRPPKSLKRSPHDQTSDRLCPTKKSAVTRGRVAECGEGDMAGSWWGGWIQSAKEKSTAALEMVRKDLAEFGCVMQQDAGHAIDVTSSTLKESVKPDNTSAAKEKLTRGINTLLEGISKALVVPPDDEGQVPIIAPSSDTYDRAKARIHAIQVDPGTYLHEPSGSPETYGMWCEGFNLEEQKGEISEMLVSKTEVRGLYTKLVPSRVSHVDFWQRYFYRLHQLDVDQARKEALMKRAERARTEDSLSWEDDWSGDEVAEDSGSDWEKLPRPNQQQRQMSDTLTPSPCPSPPTIPSTTTTTTTTTATTTPLASDQCKDSESAAATAAMLGAASVLSHQSTQESAGSGFREITLEEQKLYEMSQGLASAVQEEAMAAPAEEEASSFVLSSHSQLVTAGLSSPVEESSGSPPPEQRQSDTAFKDYLSLAGSEGVSPGDEDLETAAAAALASEEPQLLDLSPPPQVNDEKVAEVKIDEEKVTEGKLNEVQAAAAAEQVSKEKVSSSVEEDSPPPSPTVLIPEVLDLPENSSSSSACSSPEVLLCPPSSHEASFESCKQAVGEAAPALPESVPAATAAPESAAVPEEEAPSVVVVVAEESAGGVAAEAASSPVSKETSTPPAQQQALSVTVAEEGAELKTTVRGDLVVVGSDHGSPVSNASQSKGTSDVDEDWEQDLDLELTEEDMKAAEELAKKLGENINLEDDDWESWE